MEWEYDESLNCYAVWNSITRVAYFDTLEEVADYIESYYKRVINEQIY